MANWLCHNQVGYLGCGHHPSYPSHGNFGPFFHGIGRIGPSEKKGQETQTLTFNMMGWFLVIGQDFLKKIDHLPISPNQNHGTNHDKAIWRCQPHGYQICCFIRYAGVTYRPCDIIRYPDISIHIRTFIYIYTLWLFNIAMENPNHKWRFVAGKIIYKWAIFHGYVK